MKIEVELTYDDLKSAIISHVRSEFGYVADRFPKVSIGTVTTYSGCTVTLEMEEEKKEEKEEAQA